MVILSNRQSTCSVQHSILCTASQSDQEQWTLHRSLGLLRTLQPHHCNLQFRLDASLRNQLGGHLRNAAASRRRRLVEPSSVLCCMAGPTCPVCFGSLVSINLTRKLTMAFQAILHSNAPAKPTGPQTIRRRCIPVIPGGQYASRDRRRIHRI